MEADPFESVRTAARLQLFSEPGIIPPYDLGRLEVVVHQSPAVAAPCEFDARADLATMPKGGDDGFTVLRDEKRGNDWIERVHRDSLMRVSLLSCGRRGGQHDAYPCMQRPWPCV